MFKFISLALVALFALAPVASQAGETTVVSTPSTATQKNKAIRADIIYIGGPAGNVSAGAEYGLTKRVELGVDTFASFAALSNAPKFGVLNAKYRIVDQGRWYTPALAIGARGYTYNTGVPMPSQLYAVLGERVGPVYVNLGEYTSNQQFQNQTLGAQRTNGFGGVSVDFGNLQLASDVMFGNNAFGKRSYQASYAFTNDVNLGIGVQTYNNQLYGTTAGTFAFRIQLP